MAGSTVTSEIMQAEARRDPERSATAPGLSDGELCAQNAAFRATGGVSCNNRAAGFLPAYCNLSTGEAVVSQFADGRPSPVHLLDGLPAAWVAARDAAGHVREALPSVVAGFIRDGAFYTREAAARCIAQDAAAE
jgi:hypothetical protein